MHPCGQRDQAEHTVSSAQWLSSDPAEANSASFKRWIFVNYQPPIHVIESHYFSRVYVIVTEIYIWSTSCILLRFTINVQLCAWTLGWRWSHTPHWWCWAGIYDLFMSSVFFHRNQTCKTCYCWTRPDPFDSWPKSLLLMAASSGAAKHLVLKEDACKYRCDFTVCPDWMSCIRLNLAT